MQPFQTIKSKVVPLPMKDVDTDLIIPAQYLTSISREGYGENLFRRLRDTNPDFVLNQSRFQNGQILVADSNFGCGSSREHAVWAIHDYGFKVIISKSFADIFYNNSAKNGLLLVVLDEEVVDQLLTEAVSGNFEVTVDLQSQTVTLPSGQSVKFSYDEFRKHCLINGLDDIEYIRSLAGEIAAFREQQAKTVCLPCA